MNRLQLDRTDPNGCPICRNPLIFASLDPPLYQLSHRFSRDHSPIDTVSSTASARALNKLSRQEYNSAARALERTWSKWRQWIPMRKKNVSYSRNVLPENPEHISNVEMCNSGRKKSPVVRWVDQVSNKEETPPNWGSHRRSEIIESDDVHLFEPSWEAAASALPLFEPLPQATALEQPRFEPSPQPAALEQSTNFHISLADLMDQGEKARLPLPDQSLVVAGSSMAGHRSTLTDYVAAAEDLPPLLLSNQSSKSGDNELEIEERSMAPRPSGSNRYSALGQWSKTVLESCVIREELEEHWLEAQPLSDRVQLSAANLERGSLEPRPSLSRMSVSELNAINTISVAAERVRDESTISPVSSTEYQTVANSNSNPLADSSKEADNKSRGSTMKHTQSIMSSISKPPPTDRSSGIIPNRLLRAEILMRADTGKLIVSHEIEILLDTGCTDLDVVSADYCECWGHPVRQAPERLQNPYLSAMGCPVNMQGIAKIYLRWCGHSGTKTIGREFAVVEDLPQDMLLGNRTITRYNLLYESAGLLLPLLLAPRSKKDKDRDRERTREAKAIAKREESQYLEERLRRWSATPGSPFGSTSSSDFTTSSETASRTASTSRSGEQSQDGSPCTSLTSDPI